MPYSRTRLSLVEYGKPVDLIRIISAGGIDKGKASQLLLEAGQRAARTLKLSYNPISVDSRGVRAIDFAGLIRLSSSIELEIAPKFLGNELQNSPWREDFFFLATLSRHGKLLAREHLSSSSNQSRDLSTLVAKSITGMYEARKRRPLRSYRKVKESGFFIEGEPDPIDLMFPSSDGYEQEIIRFDRKNLWNANIAASARELLPEVRDPAVIGALVRLIEDISPQGSPILRTKPIPSRHKAWAPLHDLSVDVLSGLGLSYNVGLASAPGYLVATWRIWEDLISIGAKLGFGHSAVKLQSHHTLGIRSKLGDFENPNPITVKPDCIVEPTSSRPKIILDAKYKGHIEKGLLRISEADIYESLAFSKATSCNLVILAYPALPNDTSLPIGSCTLFEFVNIDSVNILGVQVETNGISKTGALKMFATNFSDCITQLAIKYNLG